MVEVKELAWPAEIDHVSTVQGIACFMIVECCPASEPLARPLVLVNTRSRRRSRALIYDLLEGARSL